MPYIKKGCYITIKCPNCRNYIKIGRSEYNGHMRASCAYCGKGIIQ